MAETMGSLVDKLAIVDLKLWHCQELLHKPAVNQTREERTNLQTKDESLQAQRTRLIGELDDWIRKAITNPDEMVLTNPQNKIYGRYRKD